MLAKLSDLAEAYVVVKRSGRTVTACCPFHDDTRPSMVSATLEQKTQQCAVSASAFGAYHPTPSDPLQAIDDEKGLYHCFACGAGGNVFKFVGELEGLNFGEVSV